PPGGAPAVGSHGAQAPAPSWSPSLWSLSDDRDASSGALRYPGGSGAGSADGFTQAGGQYVYSGLDYGLRDTYVVQADLVQTSDRVNITSGRRRGNFPSGDDLSVFFRAGAQGGGVDTR